MSTSELAQLLNELGLQQHEAAFAKNDVDLATLRLLSDADLVELGLSLGHRRKLMAALETGLTLRGSGAEPVATAAADPQAERRQITVMFCDLVDSTALTRALDPEAMEQLLHAYQNLCAGEIARFDGFVEHFMGDGVFAYFGYPRASEDAAERAVQAGLCVAQAIKGLVTPSGTPLAVRVGIATGLVVTRGRILRGNVSEHPVVGETVNLAARLQSCADPDSVVIAASTRQLIGSMFECEALGERELKGVRARRRCGASPRSGLPRPASKQHMRRARGRWLAATRKSLCCSTAGNWPARAMARSCCFQARLESANQGSARLCASTSRPTTTVSCGFSAHRLTPTARCSP